MGKNMASNDDKYDSALLAILQDVASVEGFLDSMFAFLARKTDFYLPLATRGKTSLGFPPGVSEKITLKTFKKYETIVQHQLKQQELQAKQGTEEEKKESHYKSLNKTETEELDSKNMSTAPEKTPNELKEEPQSSVTEKKKAVEGNLSPQATSMDHMKDAISKSDSSSKVTTDDTQPDAKNTSDDEDDNPELTKLQKIFQNDPDSYNGAMRDNYCWSQSINDVDVKIQVPDYITKGREVSVIIDKKHLKATYKDKDGTQVAIIDQDLTWDVRKDECMWSLMPGKYISVNLEKVQERWWEALLTDEPHINVRKIDASRPMTDLDEGAQAKIGEMMFNERQKRLGLPGSEEIKMEKIMRQAWDAEGSPFKGRPFDMSSLNIQNGGGGF